MCIRDSGLVIEIISVALVAVLMPVGLSVWWQLIPMAAYGLGLGFASAQLTSVVLSEVPIMQSGEGSVSYTHLDVYKRQGWQRE